MSGRIHLVDSMDATRTFIHP